MDLYHLLNEQIIHIPSLNDRRSEMATLVSHLLSELGAAGRMLSSDAIELLKAHKFTGGFRELRNILKRATSWFDDAEIDANMLSYVMFDGKDESAARTVSSNDFRRERVVKSIEPTANAEPISARPVPPPATGSLSLKEQERQYWEGLMHQVQGNKQKAADIAGISLRTLYRRLESAGL
ncbi:MULTISPECIES: helix-turn-helix domain-containing protein [unclassified Marinobacterium]|nr:MULTISPECIES: helix-turn-helix domain-containing protein [unclassified Marinobacterium]NRP10600.1 Nitrogen assimilation regulatory protein [Marinobacterium sp. xm-g-48]NRP83123.1 Nitrogen assimilation regulatory protein [Marinobacterium sp. xm-d-509]NRP94387.1 Nitrogen assimilation regulatory protein [Marinobacterium sp. xm-g-59]